VHGKAVEAIRDRRACRAATRVLGAEHEVVDEELRASIEEIGEGRSALVGLETVLLIDSNPRQLLPPLRQFVATSRQLLLGLEQLQACRKPLFTCSDLVISRCFSPSCRGKALLFCNHHEALRDEVVYYHLHDGLVDRE